MQKYIGHQYNDLFVYNLNCQYESSPVGTGEDSYCVATGFPGIKFQKLTVVLTSRRITVS